MIREEAELRRALRTQHVAADLVVVGGGLAGVCCAVTAARAGVKVVLVQDRPVLGGNASSEVRLWILGATSHMGNNNRWAREGGVVDEFLTENLYRNRQGNPVLVDPLLLEFVTREPNIRLLLNTAVFEVRKHDADTIAGVRAFCSQNSTMYDVEAPLFCDASGDGIVGFLAGAAFRMGAESRDEFDEPLAPSAEYGELLGHSIYFYTRDTGQPVSFVAPSFALKDIGTRLRCRRINSRQQGSELWWIEYGGRLDTVHDTEAIKWELWRVIYGLWDHIKNSGEHPEARTKTLEWVGMIPGKRESRRFEGDYILHQRDIVEQRRHTDAVSYGGWALDLHPADGIYSELDPCTQWHSRGVYQVPYRCMYSRNIRNLFLAGRIISVSHVAFSSTRVMATGAHNAQAVGMAAAMCREQNLTPRELTEPRLMRQLQLRLLRAGQHIPGLALEDDEDLARHAKLSASSVMSLSTLPQGEKWLELNRPVGVLLPVQAGPMPRVTLWVKASSETSLTAHVRACGGEGNFTPSEVLATSRVRLGHGEVHLRTAARKLVLAGGNGTPARGNGEETQATAALQVVEEAVTLDFGVAFERPQYVLLCLESNALVCARLSEHRVTGVLSVRSGGNEKVSKGDRQSPPDDIGVEPLEFWLPQRRPGGENLALRLDPPPACYAAENVLRFPSRPTDQPNGWVAALDDSAPRLTLRWAEAQTISRVEIDFDNDFDHPMESVLMGHPERVTAFCVRSFRVTDGEGNCLASVTDHHHSRRVIALPSAVRTRQLVIEVEHPGQNVPAAIMSVRVY